MEKFKIKALFLGEKINLRFIEDKIVALYPLVVELKENSYAVIFKYGAVVLFNVEEDLEKDFLSKLKPSITLPYEKPISEVSYINIKETDKFDYVDENGFIILNSFPNFVKMQVISIVLSENVILSYFEQNVGEIFDRLEPIMLNLSKGGVLAVEKEDNLLKNIGGFLKIMLKMVARVGIIDNPDVLWDNPDQERLFKALKEEYEILDRDKCLNKRFSLASDTVDTLLDIKRSAHSAKLDWYVIILIIMAVTIMAFEVF
ncbi:MAG: hypothetical protein BWY78_00117 [Alphaproteobacteria bacterium ADurb.Bin438]|nr:MAG: hypothetical protein BWY78_00117 [Alphaproteobacteria bacterium ADurb.Bin438]